MGIVRFGTAGGFIPGSEHHKLSVVRRKIDRGLPGQDVSAIMGI